LKEQKTTTKEMCDVLNFISGLESGDFSKQLTQTDDPILQPIIDKLNTAAKVLATQADASFVIDALGIGIWKWDLITNRLEWDRNMYRLYGADPTDFNGAYDAWENSLSADTKAKAIEEINNAVAGGVPFDTTFQVVQRSTGKIQEIRTRAFIIRDGNGKPLKMWGINIDRTRESELEIELKNEQLKVVEHRINLVKAQAAQQAAEDMAAVVDKAIKDRDEMIGVISHELKNPLTNMQLSTELLLKLLPQTPELEKARNIIVKINPSIKRMSRLITDLLDVTRIEAKSLKVDMKINLLDKIMIDLSEFFMPSLNEKSIQLKTNIPSDCVEVLCDEDRTIQILTNLINNSIKFTESGGKINICAKKIGSMVEITVEDTGKGISEESLTHVFDRFWQEKNTAYIGTGLGLAISKGLVEAQGGKMWVKSLHGSGTTFYFTLKLAVTEN
jgi:signal transduction histidine kinase